MTRSFATAARVAVTLAVVIAAIFVGRGIWDYYMVEPWTRDAHVRADVVGIAPDVSGLVDKVLVQDNTVVHHGDILFQIDRGRFQIALQQAEAVALGRKSALDQAHRDFQRSQNLGNFEARQSVEQNGTSVVRALSDYQEALAALDLAKLDLARSNVRASVDGVITNLSLQPGDYVSTGNPVMALIDTDSIRVEGYFEETKLSRIRVGDSAVIHIMGQQDALEGKVTSIAGGIADQERTSSAGLLANINPTFTWVQLAQRVPVLIALAHVPSAANLVVGLTATVYIQPRAARPES
jgi:RND family efflux transporter MFP subunit